MHLGSRCAIRLALAGVTAALLAGCSSDVTRFSPTPSAIRSAALRRRRPTPVRNDQPPPDASAQQVYDANRRAPLAPPSPVARYSAPADARARRSRRRFATPSRCRHPDHGQHPGWSAVGGTPVVVAEGETADAIWRSATACRPTRCCRPTGLRSAAAGAPGTRLVIPVYNAAGAPRVRSAPSESRSAPQAEEQDPAHSRRSGRASRRARAQSAKAAIRRGPHAEEQDREAPKMARTAGRAAEREHAKRQSRRHAHVGRDKLAEKADAKRRIGRARQRRKARRDRDRSAKPPRCASPPPSTLRRDRQPACRQRPGARPLRPGVRRDAARRDAGIPLAGARPHHPGLQGGRQ